MSTVEQKSLLTELGEAIDRYRAGRRAALGDETPQRARPSRLARLLRWLTPNGGTILLVLALVLTQRVWARALFSPAATGPSATTVNYQGRLADSGGAPLDGTYGMSFALWDASAEGNLIWGPESLAAVPVSDGLFSVGLGSQTTGGIPTSTWNGDRYLEISVGGETLSPRELIRSVPIAGMALTVPDGAIGSRHVAPSWYVANLTAPVSTTSTEYVPTGEELTFTCDTACTALILHRGMVAHSVADRRVNVRVAVDGVAAFQELGVGNVARDEALNRAYESVSGFAFVNLDAGTHTVTTEVRCDGSSPGTCYYYGKYDDWEQLSVLLFHQP